MNAKWHKLLPYGFMALAALSRWPGLFPPGFSAFYALTFCAGAFFTGAAKWWLPFGTILATDVVLNVAYYHVSPLSGLPLVNYGAFAVIIWIGKKFSARSSFLGLLFGGLLGAVLFYLITNTASWLTDPGYPKTLAGWIQALTVGLPGYPPTWTFFRNTLLSGGLFTGVFVGGMKSTESPREKEVEQNEEEPEGEGAAAEQ